MISAWRAPLWRIALVAPSRTAHASTDSTSGVQRLVQRVDVQLDPGRLERDLRAGQLARQRRLPVAADRLADLGSALRVSSRICSTSVAASSGAGGQQLAGQLGLERDQRQVVTEQVVQVAGEAQPLLGHRHLGQLGARLAQRLVGAQQAADQHPQRAGARTPRR